MYYQEWNNLVFMHGRVDMNWLKQLVPPELTIDTFDGDPWISVVPFGMQKIRPYYLPATWPISDFAEINIRTYVSYNGKPGVYFLSIEGSKWLSCYFAKSISGLPYRYKPFTFSKNELASPHLSFGYEAGEVINAKSDLELWATERYCLYNKLNNNLFRYDIHHIPWPLHKVNITDLHVRYPLLKTMNKVFKVESAQYSPGVQVMAWSKVKVS